MRHYIVIAEGDDVEVTFIYDALPSVKRVYTAPPRVVAEVEAGQREQFWQDLGRPQTCAAQHVYRSGEEVACVREHGHAGSHRSADGGLFV